MFNFAGWGRKTFDENSLPLLPLLPEGKSPFLKGPAAAVRRVRSRAPPPPLWQDCADKIHNTTFNACQEILGWAQDHTRA